VITMLVAVRTVRDRPEEDDVSPAQAGWAANPPGQTPEESGRVVIQVDYQIDPARAAAFRRVMEETRRVRLSQGAIEWALWHDVRDPGHFVEYIVDESWTEHLRRFHRATAADIALRERRLAFHIGEEPPGVVRYVQAR